MVSPMGAALPEGISASPRPAQALRDPWRDAKPLCRVRIKHTRRFAPLLQLQHGSEEPCTSPACKTCPKGQGRLGGLFPAAPPVKALGMGLGGSGRRGCSTQIVLPTPSSDCSMERGERGEPGVGESSGRAGIPSCPTPGARPQAAPGCSPSCLFCSGTCTRSPCRS